MFNKTLHMLKQIFPLFMAFLILNSCESEVKPITFQSQTIQKKYDADITVNFDEAKGNSDISSAINTNIEKAIIASLNDSENKTNLKDVLKTFNDDYKTFITNFSDEDPKWELHIETELTYKSDAIITLAISTYEYKGGAHGNDKIKFLNLDAKTGAVLKQNDILKDLDGFKKIAEDHFIKSLEAEDTSLTMEDYFFGKPFQLPENMGYSDDGLVLLYNVYEVASYDQGYIEFVIPFEEIQSYLKID